MLPKLATTAKQDINKNTRDPTHHNHDGIDTALHAPLESEKLLQHNMLPESIIVTTTLSELEDTADKVLTGCGSSLPMSNVIHLTQQARHHSIKT
ncbi:DUF222 domain-containing protein [Mycobacterium leprae]|uniref:U296h n=1 Tax=Mycobacterium leprae TaxID=1769 RepID=Q50147_MYCLR|nr:DUF222 domain-containing protein [Mycobacterium leprae]OAX70214.1 hypothetical protein A3216_13325 [Mycobacterium leprae 7935681]AAA63128.1 u296h [Mycobacterium leprae]OAR20025.1 hypothetical protein A8144_03560 [Mycobacterium leprae 3125609]OAR20340.1 hypothetical protein A8144_11375 [Mycobacterium leprae 3125609]OAR21217.1 hypothetical protein A8144_07620 [Mycobacterium leprae 3125609]